MPPISTLTRISLALSILTVSLLLIAHSMGFVPDLNDGRAAEARAARTVAEVTAIQLSFVAQRNDTAAVKSLVEALVQRNKYIVEVTVRHQTGRLLAHAKRTDEQPAQAKEGTHKTTNLVVPIFRDKRRWGTVEFEFQPIMTAHTPVWLGTPMIPLSIMLGLSSFLAFTWYLKRVLTHLDPSAVIPDRVHSALDTLAEGVVILDESARIVLANQAFCRNLGRPAEKLFGQPLSNLPWTLEASQARDKLPWVRVLGDGSSQTRVLLKLSADDNRQCSFSVNVVPITGNDGRCHGALATFDDLTLLEEKNTTLNGLLQVLEQSHGEIRAQNEELQFLATRDPLTSCFNRRAFFARAEKAWNIAVQAGRTCGCIMVDVDHFKSFNDNHGHAVGDEVLKHTAGILRAGVRESDIVCRYGGEEFCILVVDADLATVVAIAEKLRQSIEQQPCQQLKITVSLGVALSGAQATELAAALEQADKSLYASKRSGRNRVTSWQDLVDRGETDATPEKPAAHRRQEVAAVQKSSISLQAVRTLFGALSTRDRATAEHSLRVANLCVVIGQKFLSEDRLNVLEAAALLHDIGKLGVPDSVLLKPGKLTPEEWQIMDTHDDIGCDIVGLAVGCERVQEIVRTHHAWYQGNPRDASLPIAEHIPLEARILAMADAYDAIVSDRVYRLGRSHDEAIAELQRCAGVQFDPNLVDTFTATLSEQRKSPSPPSVLGEIPHAGPAVAAMPSAVAMRGSSDQEDELLQIAEQLLEISNAAREAEPQPVTQAME